MKQIRNIIWIIVASFVIASCDFMDVVPENIATYDDAFKNEYEAENSLFGLYSYMPAMNGYRDNVEHVTDELGFPTGWGLQWFAAKKMWTMNHGISTVGFNYWSTGQYGDGGKQFNLYEGIRYCYMFLQKIDGVAGVSATNSKQWKAEATFLIAYYHFMLFRVYGPIICVDRAIPFDASTDEVMQKRSSIDESVDFIANLLKSVVNDLPATYPNQFYGKPTSIAAKALLARLYLYAASPFFNGNQEPLFKDYAGPDGVKLFPQSFDNEKWKRAMDATKEAIDAAHAAGIQLYEYAGNKPDAWLTWTDEDKLEATNRFKIVDAWNKELIWGHSGKKDSDFGNPANDAWQFQGPRYDRTTNRMLNSVCPTMDIAERFYTKNGLPIDKDPAYDYDNRFTVMAGDSTAYLHRDREPRFYSTIAFDRGTYEVRGTTINIQMRNNGTDIHGKIPNFNDCSSTGFLLKKLTHPSSSYDKNQTQLTNYPYPIVRLAELYLSYAEAYFEYNGSLAGDALTYFDNVRKRAGIPDLTTSWAAAGGVPTGNDLREVIKRERLNEMAYESLVYFDVRRWCDAEKYNNHNMRGWNTDGATQDDFYTVISGNDNLNRVFDKKFYLLPIPSNEVEINYNISQNPGWQ